MWKRKPAADIFVAKLSPSILPSLDVSTPAYLPADLPVHPNDPKWIFTYLRTEGCILGTPYKSNIFATFSVLTTSKNSIISPHSIKAMACQSKVTCPATEKKRFVRPTSLDQ